MRSKIRRIGWYSSSSFSCSTSSSSSLSTALTEDEFAMLDIKSSSPSTLSSSLKLESSETELTSLSMLGRGGLVRLEPLCVCKLRELMDRCANVSYALSLIARLSRRRPSQWFELSARLSRVCCTRTGRRASSGVRRFSTVDFSTLTTGCMQGATRAGTDEALAICADNSGTRIVSLRISL